MRYYTDTGLRLLSIHAHSDGTWKEFLSRPGKRLVERLVFAEDASRAEEDTEPP